VAAETVLETHDLTKDFAGFVAVRAVNLRVARGAIHAMIGPNGAGKTTCFNLLSKFLAPSRGRIVFEGRDITALRPAEVARLGLVRSFQISAVFAHLSVFENVRIALQRRRGGSFDFWRSKRLLHALDDRAEALIAEVGLSGFSGTLAAELPYGRKRALELATTIALDPKMLLLDEPMSGMAREDIDRISALIRSVAAARTVLMVEHNLSVVADLCDRITVLSRGEVLAEGDYATVAADPVVREAYLGMGHANGGHGKRGGNGHGDSRVNGRGNVAATAADGTIQTPTRTLPGAAQPLLAVDALQAWYGESHVLHGVSFDVNAGEVVTLLGRNGVGKTTTLKAIMGMVEHRTGSVRLAGNELTGLAADAIARAGIAICPEDRGIFASLDVRENLLLPPQSRPGGLDLPDIFRLFPNLSERLRSPGTKLSGGEQQMLAIARILRAGARLLLLDEPTEGLAPVVIGEIGRTIGLLKGRGFTILLVEQNFNFAAAVADRYYVMEHGRIVDRFSAAELPANMGKLHEYLGV
jgi:ABC-type branched-subunit amino acid transport system ATPase component